MPSGKQGVTRGRLPTTVDLVKLSRLKTLSDQTKINQSKLIDEAIDDLLNKYGDDPRQHIIKKRQEEY